MQPEAVELIVLAAAALAFAVAFSPPAASRRELLGKGGAGIVGAAAIAAVPTFDLTLLVLLALGVLQSVIGGKRPLAIRLRGPVVAVALLGLGAFFARVQGPDGRWTAASVASVLRDPVYAGGAYGAAAADPPLVSRPVWRKAQH